MPSSVLAGFQLPSRKQIVIILAALSLAACCQHAWYWGQLPERVATHFGVQGQPNDWMSRSAATVVMLATQIGLPWMLYGIAGSIRLFPVSLINVPNREYWLQGERREESLDYVQRMVGSVAILSSLLTAVIAHLAFDANRTGQGLAMGWFGFAMAIHMMAVTLLVAALYVRFRLPREIKPSASVR
jgi:uncharacterized membrane protein